MFPVVCGLSVGIGFITGYIVSQMILHIYEVAHDHEHLNPFSNHFLQILQ